MKLSDAHKHYLLSEQIINPALVNIIVNGAISWLSLRNADIIYYWQDTPIGPDLLLTGFLLPFIMTMINSRLVAGKVYKGDLDHIPPVDFGPQGWYRRPIFMRSLYLGGLGVLLFAVPTVLILPNIWPAPLSLWGVVMFKAVWAAVLAVLVCPVIAVWAIESASTKKQRNERTQRLHRR